MRHASRFKSPVKIAAASLWVASLTLMVLGTVLDGDRVILRSWALWIQMVAWGFTAWWIADGLSRRDRLRVAELAEIMARVAAESNHHEAHPPPHYPRRVKLTRVH